MIEKMLNRLTKAANRGAENVLRRLNISEPLLQAYETIDESDLRVLEKMVGREAVEDFVKRMELKRVVGDKDVIALD